MELRMSASMRTPNLELRDHMCLLLGLSSLVVEVQIRILNKLQSLSFFNFFSEIWTSIDGRQRLAYGRYVFMTCCSRLCSQLRFSSTRSIGLHDTYELYLALFQI